MVQEDIEVVVVDPIFMEDRVVSKPKTQWKSSSVEPEEHEKKSRSGIARKKRSSRRRRAADPAGEVMSDAARRGSDGYQTLTSGSETTKTDQLSCSDDIEDNQNRFQYPAPSKALKARPIGSPRRHRARVPRGVRSMPSQEISDTESIWSQQSFVINTSEGVEDHYRTLGVKEDATTDEIRERFKELILQLHPDRMKVADNNWTPEERQELFAKISFAHNVRAPSFSRNFRSGTLSGCQSELTYCRQRSSTGAHGSTEQEEVRYDTRRFLE